LRRPSAIDDGRGDVGRQPGKTQKGARAMILSKLGSAAVWSSAFSTSMRISRPTRFISLPSCWLGSNVIDVV
jgi:hypothetical protein